MLVLGVHGGHDASAALIKDGVVVADISEERVARKKHYGGMPFGAIDYCMSMTDTVDLVAISSESYPTRALEDLYGSHAGSSLPHYFNRYHRLTSEIHKVPHHKSHASSAYFTSGADWDAECLVITIDGAGDDGLSLGVWLARQGTLELLHHEDRTGSLGWFYSIVTEALGWWIGDGEGKTMGLAPYGDSSSCIEELWEYCPQYQSGYLVKGQPYERGPDFVPHNGARHYHFEQGYLVSRMLDKRSPEEIASAAQEIIEIEVLGIVSAWIQRTGIRQVHCAGGLFLNVKLNQRIRESIPEASFWVYPNPGDAGLAAGCALQTYFQTGASTQISALNNLFLGPEYSNDEIESRLRLSGLAFRKVVDPSEAAAELLSRDAIVGWFQGRMEAGPRALGARSILMSPKSSQNKDILNRRVKFRENFRPFCPSMPFETRERYLVASANDKFMITSTAVQPSAANRIPAVVHVDGSARPQCIERPDFPLYYDLLTNFGNRTGDPVLLNTSMNLAGEPIALSVEDAIKCYFASGMDALVMGDCLLEKTSSGI